MLGSTARRVTMLGLVDPDQLIPAGHPIRDMKPIVEEALNGREARLSLAGHVLMENRSRVVVDIEVTRATGFSEREAGLAGDQHSRQS